MIFFLVLVCSCSRSEDMFKSAMSTMNIDVKKMPLGQLSNAQVCFGVLRVWPLCAPAGSVSKGSCQTRGFHRNVAILCVWPCHSSLVTNYFFSRAVLSIFGLLVR